MEGIVIFFTSTFVRGFPRGIIATDINQFYPCITE